MHGEIPSLPASHANERNRTARTPCGIDCIATALAKAARAHPGKSTEGVTAFETPARSTGMYMRRWADYYAMSRRISPFARQPIQLVIIVAVATIGLAIVQHKRCSLRKLSQLCTSVSDELWVVYRLWVDANVERRLESSFHVFAYARVLGQSKLASVTGNDAAKALTNAALSATLYQRMPECSQPANVQMHLWLRECRDAFDAHHAVRRAVALADVPQVIALLDGGALEHPDSELPPAGELGAQGGEPALHVAARAGHPSVALLLLDRHADVHSRSSDNGSTPLHCAAQCRGAETLALLLARGANVCAKTSTSQSTALHLAALHGRVCQRDHLRIAVSHSHMTFTLLHALPRDLLSLAFSLIYLTVTERPFDLAGYRGQAASCTRR